MKSRLQFIFGCCCIFLLSYNTKAQNYSLEFDGVDDQISVSTLSTSANFTYEMWVYFPSDPGDFVTLLDFANDNPWLGIASGLFALWDGGTQSTDSFLQNDRWKHLAVTYTSNTIKLYEDGVLEKTITKTVSNSVTGMTIGFSTGDGYFSGRMDELRIWNTERSASEIADNMFSSLTGTETGLVAYYNFDEGTGTTLNDLTSNSHDGTLTNFPTDPWEEGAPVGMNTWNGSTWSDGTPSVSDNIMLEDDYDFSSAGLEVNSLYIHEDADVIVDGNYLEINGDLQTNGSLTVSSGSSLLTSGDQLTLGNDITFQRTTTHSASAGKYSAVGMSTQTGNRDALGSVVYQYDETQLFNSTADNSMSGNDGLDRFSPVSSGEDLVAGIGYFSAFTGDIDFSGKPNAGTIDIDITYTNHDVAGTSDEENYEGFNLISNPYPAPITLSSFISENTSEIEGTIYLWNDGGSDSDRRTDSDYILANSMGATGGSGGASDWDGSIRSFQGFLVKAKSASTISFTDVMKTTSDNDDDSFYRVDENVQLLRIALSDNEVRSECLIGANEESTSAYDELYDAFKPVPSGFFSIYSILENSTMGIQAIPKGYDQSLKLGLQIDHEGMYSLAIEENSFNQSIMLVDHYTNRVIDVTNETYSFNSPSGKFDDRFELNFSQNTLGIEIEDFQLSQNDNSLIINNNTTSIHPFKLITISGKTLYSGKLIPGKNELNVIENGILIFQMEENRPVKFHKH